MRSVYHRAARLATHPSFQRSAGRLVCPRCPQQTFDRVAAFNEHVLAHDLTESEARRWLDWRAFRRLAGRNSWSQDG